LSPHPTKSSDRVSSAEWGLLLYSDAKLVVVGVRSLPVTALVGVVGEVGGGGEGGRSGRRPTGTEERKCVVDFPVKGSGSWFARGSERWIASSSITSLRNKMK
jgi:hypothetical protein